MSAFPDGRRRGDSGTGLPGWIRAAKSDFPQRGKARRDKASDHAPVMLHLRACHASKAAILTIPAAIFAGRKSKSRLNSKGLDR